MTQSTLPECDVGGAAGATGTHGPAMPWPAATSMSRVDLSAAAMDGHEDRVQSA